jgi:hypothetical protein
VEEPCQAPDQRPVNAGIGLKSGLCADSHTGEGASQCEENSLQLAAFNSGPDGERRHSAPVLWIGGRHYSRRGRRRYEEKRPDYLGPSLLQQGITG